MLCNSIENNEILLQNESQIHKVKQVCQIIRSLQWRHNERDGVSNDQMTSFWIVYSTVCSRAELRQHQSSTSLAFVRGIQQVAYDFPAQRASNVEKFPFDAVIMC